MNKGLFFIILLGISAVTCGIYQAVREERVLCHRADTLFFQKKYAAAIPLYRSSLEKGLPAHLAAPRLAFCHSEAGSAAEAILLYEEIRSRGTPNPWTTMTLAGLYARQRNFDRACGLYREAVEFDPKSRAARLYLARSLSAARRFDEAADEYRTLLGEKR